MKTNILVILIGLLVAVGGGGAYLLTRDDKPASNTQSPQTSQTSQNSPTNTEGQTGEEIAMQGNLQSLRSDGKARACTMSYNSSDGNGTGTMYTDGKGRGRIQIDLTTARGNKGQSNTLVTDEKVYSWTATDGGSFGFVTNASSIPEHSTGSPTTSNSQTAGKDFDLKCRTWTVDEAILVVPTNVTFTALTNTP